MNRHSIDYKETFCINHGISEEDLNRHRKIICIKHGVSKEDFDRQGCLNSSTCRISDTPECCSKFREKLCAILDKEKSINSRSSVGEGTKVLQN